MIYYKNHYDKWGKRQLQMHLLGGLSIGECAKSGMFQLGILSIRDVPIRGCANSGIKRLRLVFT